MKIRTIIIEDEKPAVRRLEKLLSLFSDLEVVASLNSVEESVDWFQGNEHPQLIFSDIVLGEPDTTLFALPSHSRVIDLRK